MGSLVLALFSAISPASRRAAARITAACAVLAASPALAAGLIPLDFEPIDVSADGQVVLGADALWSRSAGHLGDVGGDGTLVALGAEGGRAVGTVTLPVPPPFDFLRESYDDIFVWNEGMGIDPLDAGSVDAWIARPFDLSSNGRYLSGTVYAGGGLDAYLWDLDGGGRTFVSSGSGSGTSFRSVEPLAVSNTGVVVGREFRIETSGSVDDYFRWDAAGGGISLQTPAEPSGNDGPLAISADASTIVGSVQVAPGDAGVRAVRWNAAGELSVLTGLPGYNGRSVASAVSADGAVIAGTVEGLGSDADPGSTVVLWDRDGEAHALEVLLAALGVDLGGFSLDHVEAISDDGRTIVGRGTNGLGETQGFLAIIPEPGTALLIGLGLLGLAAQKP